MSFGRRASRERNGWGEADKGKLNTAHFRDPRHLVVTEEKSMSGLLIALIGIAAAAGAVYFFGDPATMKAMMRGSSRPPAVFDNAGYDNEMIKLCGTEKSIKGRVLNRFDPAADDAPVLSAQHLHCLMQNHRERFCHFPAQRSALVGHLTTYLKYHHDRAILAERLSQDPRAARAMSVHKTLATGSDNDTLSSKGPDASVVSEMQQLLRDSYIEKWEFGWTPPSFLAPHLDKVEPTQKSCG